MRASTSECNAGRDCVAAQLICRPHPSVLAPQPRRQALAPSLGGEVGVDAWE